MTTEKTPACNTGLAKVAVQCSASTFMVISSPFAKRENFESNSKSFVHIQNNKTKTRDKKCKNTQ